MSAYVYAGLDPALLELVKDLESLGGGDAKVEHPEVYTVIDNRTPVSLFNSSNGRNEKQINYNVIKPLGTSLGIQNVGLLDNSDGKRGGNATIAESMQYYNVNATALLPEVLNSPGGYIPPVNDILQWNLQGYNANVVAFGQKDSGKTLSMLGPSPHFENSQPKLNSEGIEYPAIGLENVTSFVEVYLKGLFAHKERVSNSKKIYSKNSLVSIGLSMWCVNVQNVVDLLAGSENDKLHPANLSSFVTIDCPTYDIAMKIIATGRSMRRLIGCDAANNSNSFNRECNQAHLFIRITTHQDLRYTESVRSRPDNTKKDEVLLSNLHVVDLLGMGGQMPSVPHGAGLNWKSKMVSSAARARVGKELEQDQIAFRETQLQLSTCLKVITQMKSVGKASMLGANSKPTSYGSVYDEDTDSTVYQKVTSARESVLTIQLAPLLLGNAKTWFVLYLKDGEPNYHITKNILDSFSNASRELECACYKVEDIPLIDLSMRHHNTALFSTRTELTGEGNVLQNDGKFHTTSTQAKNEHAREREDAQLNNRGVSQDGDITVELEGTDPCSSVMHDQPKWWEQPLGNSSDRDQFDLEHTGASPSLHDLANSPYLYDSEHEHLPSDGQDNIRQTDTGIASFDSDMEPDSLIEMPEENGGAGLEAGCEYEEEIEDDNVNLFQLSSQTLPVVSSRYVNAVQDYYDEEERGLAELQSLGKEGLVSYSDAVAHSLRGANCDRNISGYDSLSSAAKLRNQWYDDQIPDPDDLRARDSDFGHVSSTSTCRPNSFDGMNVSDDPYVAGSRKSYESSAAVEHAGQSSKQTQSQNQPFDSLMNDFHKLMSSVEADPLENPGFSVNIQDSSEVRREEEELEQHQKHHEFELEPGGEDRDEDREGGRYSDKAAGMDSREDMVHTIDKQDKFIQNLIGAKCMNESDVGVPAVSREHAAARLGALIQLGLEGTEVRSGPDTSSSLGYSQSESQTSPSSPNRGAAFEATIRSEMRKVSNMYVFGSPDGKPRPDLSKQIDAQIFDREDEIQLIQDLDMEADSLIGMESNIAPKNDSSNTSRFMGSKEAQYKAQTLIGTDGEQYGSVSTMNHINKTRETASSKQELFWRTLNKHCSQGDDVTISRDFFPNTDTDEFSNDNPTLDKASLDVTDLSDKVDVLVTTNEALMKTVQGLQRNKKELLKKIEILESSVMEANIQRGIESDNYKLDISKLNAQLKKMCYDQSLTTVFDDFEDHLNRLVHENSELRKENLKYECGDVVNKCMEGTTAGWDNSKGFKGISDIAANEMGYSGKNVLLSADFERFEQCKKNSLSDHIHSGDSDAVCISIKDPQYHRKQCVLLRNKLRKSGAERLELRRHCEELHKRERQHKMSVRLAQDSNRRLKTLYYENTKLKESLAAERAAHNECIRALNCLKSDNMDISENEVLLKEERSRNLAEVALLRERVRELDNERVQLLKMTRLAKSHQANTQPPAVPNPNKCVKTNSTNNCAPKLKQSSEPVYQHKNGSVTSKCLQVPDYDLKYTAGGSGGQYTVIPHLKHNPNPMRYSTGSISNNGNIAHGPYASSGDGVNPPGDPHAKFLANGHGLVGVAGLSNAMYTRLEETAVLNEDVAVAFNNLHNGLVLECPSLLPALKQLSNKFLEEKSKSVQQKSDLIGKNIHLQGRLTKSRQDEEESKYRAQRQIMRQNEQMLSAPDTNTGMRNGQKGVNSEKPLSNHSKRVSIQNTSNPTTGKIIRNMNSNMYNEKNRDVAVSSENEIASNIRMSQNASVCTAGGTMHNDSNSFQKTISGGSNYANGYR